MNSSLRRVGILAGLAAAGVAVLVGVSAASTRHAAPRTAPTFTMLWEQHNSHAGFRTPGEATLDGSASVLTGDSLGVLHAYAIGSGAVVGGWPVRTDAATYPPCPSSRPHCGYVALGVASPPSSTSAPGGSEVVIEAGGGNIVRGADNEPDFEGFSATGRVLFRTNPADETRYSKAAIGRQGSVQGLSGVALASVRGARSGFAGGTTSHTVWGIQAQSGAERYSLLNGDTSLQPPAVGSLGATTPTLVYQTADFSYDSNTGAGFSGGHLRIIAPSGAEVCNANIRAPDPKDNYGGGGFGTAAAVGSLGGVPLVMFGQGNRWTGSDRVLAFDAACQLEWRSPPLAGPTNFAPAIADVQGAGTPVVIEEVRNAHNAPVIYELNGAGTIAHHTTLTGCKGIAPTQPTDSVATADLTGQGYQDIIAPAGSCGYAVLDGRTLTRVHAGGRSGYLSPRCGRGRLQGDHTPLITATGSSRGSIAVTLTGDSTVPSSGGCIVTFAVRGVPGHTAAVGDNGWPEYQHDPALSGIASTSLRLHPARDVLGPTATLSAGQQLVSANGRFRAVMQPDGNFVVYAHTSSGQRVLFATATDRAPKGVRLVMQRDGNLVVYDAAGKPRWSSHTGRHDRPTELVMQGDGNLVIYQGPPAGSISGIQAPIWATRTRAKP